MCQIAVVQKPTLDVEGDDGFVTSQQLCQVRLAGECSVTTGQRQEEQLRALVDVWRLC